MYWKHGLIGAQVQSKVEPNCIDRIDSPCTAGSRSISTRRQSLADNAAMDGGPDSRPSTTLRMYIQFVR